MVKLTKTALLAFSLAALPFAGFAESKSEPVSSPYIKNFNCATDLAKKAIDYAVAVNAKLPKVDFSGNLASLYKAGLNNEQIVAGMDFRKSLDSLNSFLDGIEEDVRKYDEKIAEASFNSSLISGHWLSAKYIAYSVENLVQNSEKARLAFDVSLVDTIDAKGRGLSDRAKIVGRFLESNRVMIQCPRPQ